MFRKNSYRTDSDEALMAALIKGRHRALAELYRRYEEPVRWYFYRMTGRDEELARDMCQDLFVKVAESAGKYTLGRSFRTWLYSMAHNMCKNLYRHREVQRRVHDDLREQLPESLPPAELIAGIDAEVFRQRLDATLEKLDTARRGAFLLRHRQGMSIREIAEVQDCPPGTVKSRLHYAHAFLAQELSDLKKEIEER